MLIGGAEGGDVSVFEGGRVRSVGLDGLGDEEGAAGREVAVHELTVALAKGRVARSVLPMFEEIGCDVAQLGRPSMRAQGA